MTENSGVILVRLKKDKGRKKSLSLMKGIDRVADRAVEAQATFIDVYGKRHQESNRLKRSGWLRDLSKNVLSATRKSLKKAKPRVSDLLPF